MTRRGVPSRVLYGSTYYGRHDRPVHVVLDTGPGPGPKPTACGRRLDIGTPTLGPSENVTCHRCLARLDEGIDDG